MYCGQNKAFGQNDDLSRFYVGVFIQTVKQEIGIVINVRKWMHRLTKVDATVFRVIQPFEETNNHNRDRDS